MDKYMRMKLGVKLGVAFIGKNLGVILVLLALGYLTLLTPILAIHFEFQKSWLYSHILVLSSALGIITFLVMLNYLMKCSGEYYKGLKAEYDRVNARDAKNTKVAFENSFEQLTSISNSAAHYKKLSSVLEKEKNKANEEANKYKDLYERLLFSQKVLVEQLTRENEQLKDALSKISRNAIEDLE